MKKLIRLFTLALVAALLMASASCGPVTRIDMTESWTRESKGSGKDSVAYTDYEKYYRAKVRPPRH